MRAASSLSNRMFLACTVLAILSLGFAFSFVNARAVAEAEAGLRRELVDAASQVDENRAFLTDTFTRHARLVADLPKLKGAVDTGDPPTVQPLAVDYRRQVNADLLVVSDPHGRVLGAAGADHPVLPLAPGRDDELSLFLPHPRGILQIVSVPILLGVRPTELLGRLTVGVFLDDRLAARFKALTGSEIAFAADGRIVASSLPASAREPLRQVIASDGVAPVQIGDDEYLVLARSMPRSSANVTPAASPVVLILRSRTERLRFLNTLRTGLTGALVLTVLLATILSYAVARTMTRPLAAITGAMREVAATGDLTRKVVLRSRAWDDEDARLLATTFNTLTESIARFQKEAAQRERLSSLGRLSTVVAHEIRNPLMIIRATLATLRRDSITPAELREAIADIDEETTRLNRLVTEVLDFARPIRFELAEASLNDLCRASAAAAWTGPPETSPPIELALDETVPRIVTDAERLRTALVNILTNARHAAHAAERPDAPGAASRAADPPGGAPTAVLAGPGVRLETGVDGERVIITVRDHGAGIAADDLAQVFDPYFTTRRGGTGLGLPIAKNIIEGLGGTLAVRSRVGEGTEIRIELPRRAERAA
jgi:signal transduction histidine kinase